MIKIVGLGPGAPEALTIGTVKILQESSNIVFRTEKHPTVDYLKESMGSFETYDSYYEKYDNFDKVYEEIANDIVKEYKEKKEIVYAVPGHPLVAEKSVINIINKCKENEIQYEIVPAVSFIDAMMECLQIDPVEGLKIIDAFDINNQILDKRVGNIITQVYNQFIASEVKLALLDNFNDETEIYFVRAAGVVGEESIRKIPLFELDMQEDIDYLTSIYIPKDLENKKDIYDFIEVVDVLRSEKGCPWDREQTHESIKNQLIEECYEVVDAINNDDIDGIIEELGDVLLHVIFHASIGKEDGYFDFSDIIKGIYEKMINRHPHVFGNISANDSETVLENWDNIKKKEKRYKSLSEDMESVAKALPALIRASKVQKKAAKIGFDWKDAKEASEKVVEELNEVLEVYNSNDVEKIKEEVGDLLFSCVNVARLLKIDEEESLNLTTEKFISRIKIMEELAKEKNEEISKMNLEELNVLWDYSKKYKKM